MIARNTSPCCPDGRSEAQTTVGFQAPGRQCAEGMMTAGPYPRPRPRGGGCVSWLAALPPGTPRKPCWAMRGRGLHVHSLGGCPAPGSHAGP